ncbi:thiamine-phosphate pyrophosphorylase [Candidatus Omnitrophota bacterium]
MAKFTKELVYRILDANINRAAEGMRVCEEVVRFILNDRRLTAKLRKMRHAIFRIFDPKSREKFLKKRSSRRDVGRLLHGGRGRANYQDVFFANMQRVKESIRVLEEFYKLLDIKAVNKLKKIRYHVYEVEKKAAFEFSALSGIRQRRLP